MQRNVLTTVSKSGSRLCIHSSIIGQISRLSMLTIMFSLIYAVSILFLIAKMLFERVSRMWNLRHTDVYSSGHHTDGVDGAELLAAAEEGRVDIVREILEKDGDMMFVGDAMGDNILHKATRAGKSEVVKEVVRIAEICGQLERMLKQKNINRDIALTLADRSGNLQVKKCLDTARNSVPYFMSRMVGDESAVADMEMVLRRKILDEEPKPDWWNPTHLRSVLIRCPEKTTLERLKKLANSADKLAKLMLNGDELGYTLLHWALDSEKLQVARVITKMVPQAVYAVNNKEISPLCLAVKMGDQGLVRFMIDKVPQPNKRILIDHAMKACLPHVAIKANIGTLRILMKKLPHLINSSNPKIHKGWKPLSYAASKGKLDQVRFLLTEFPNSVDKFDEDGSLPIHKAVAGGCIEVVREFMAQSQQALCGIDRKSRSVLHIAAMYRKADILSYLLKQDGVGKIMNVEDNEGKTFKGFICQ